MVQRVYKFSKFKNFVDEENASFNVSVFEVKFIKPEAEWSNHEQVEKFMAT